VPLGPFPVPPFGLLRTVGLAVSSFLPLPLPLSFGLLKLEMPSGMLLRISKTFLISSGTSSVEPHGLSNGARFVWGKGVQGSARVKNPGYCS